LLHHYSAEADGDVDAGAIDNSNEQDNTNIYSLSDSEGESGHADDESGYADDESGYGDNEEQDDNTGSSSEGGFSGTSSRNDSDSEESADSSSIDEHEELSDSDSSFENHFLLREGDYCLSIVDNQSRLPLTNLTIAKPDFNKILKQTDVKRSRLEVLGHNPFLGCIDGKVQLKLLQAIADRNMSAIEQCVDDYNNTKSECALKDMSATAWGGCEGEEHEQTEQEPENEHEHAYEDDHGYDSEQVDETYENITATLDEEEDEEDKAVDKDTHDFYHPMNMPSNQETMKTCSSHVDKALCALQDMLEEVGAYG
jgi:hypothetical protein